MRAASSPSLRVASLAAAAGILFSRLGGLAREMVMAACFGAGPVFDAFVVAFRIPSTFRQFVAEGAFTVACLPHYIDARDRGPAEEGDFLAAVILRWSLLLLAITAAAVVAMPLLVDLFAPGFRLIAAQRELTIELGRVTAGFIWLVGAYGFAQAIAQGRKRFFWVHLAPLALNLGMIAAVLPGWLQGADPRQTVRWLAWGVVGGGIGQLLISLSPLVAGVRPHWRRSWTAKGGFFPVLKTALPASLGLAVWQIQIIVVTSMASLVGAGTISILFYADRLIQLPLALIGTATGAVSLSFLAERAASDEQYGQTLDQALGQAWLLIAPAAAGLFVLAEPLVKAIYGRGVFANTDVLAVREVMVVLACGLPAAVSARILTSGFHGRKDTRTPVFIAFIVVAVVAVCSVLLAPDMGVRGLAIALAAGSWCQALLAGGLLCRRKVRWYVVCVPQLPRLIGLGVLFTLLLQPLLRVPSIWMQLALAALAALPLWALLIYVFGGSYWKQRLLLLKRRR